MLARPTLAYNIDFYLFFVYIPVQEDNHEKANASHYHFAFAASGSFVVVLVQKQMGGIVTY
ncbi:MAG TPA: hypothetical protein VLK22_04070 [Candidatus Udaeobacter sp.]|nr:hypothetical protein [Candidatus Udaeobacter sp.]